jgi:hypothetical protein
MAKDPAFLFYSQDFLTGVSDLTMEERGQYITLLCLQHQKGHLSKKIINISVPGVSKDVISKFDVDKSGLFFNKRLDDEKEKRRLHSEKQRDRSIKGWEKRKAAAYTTADAAALPLEDEDENEDVIVNESAVEKKKSDTVSLKVQGNEVINELVNDRQWTEQFRMKHKHVKDWKLFFDYLQNKCIIEEIDHDKKKVIARANLLASNWKEEKKKISQQDQILRDIEQREWEIKNGLT